MGVGSSAAAAPRDFLFAWRYPESEGYAGIALYHAPSEAELLAGQNLTRVDLGLQSAAADGVATIWVSGFDDSRDYYVALRTYDWRGNESAYSRTGIIRAQAAVQTVIHAEGFESYRAGQDPDNWLDTASGSMQPGVASLFETIELSDGTIAFGTTSAEVDIHSHFVDTDSRHWASYEYTGRMRSDSLVGEAGVTFLSGFPDASFYYRLARSGTGPFTLSTRQASELRCAAQTSTGVAAQAGAWSRFQIRVTRFERRNRVRVKVWSDGTEAPVNWQVDCWDRLPQTVEAGRIGVYSSNGAGNFWDDLRLVGVGNDGAPPAYTPEPTPPSPSGSGYTSGTRLVHWWNPGRDIESPGRDFAASATPIDATDFKGVGQRDMTAPGSVDAFVALNGSSKSFGNRELQPYGIGDDWSLAVWLRPDALSGKKPRYVLDLNASRSNRSGNRISLVIGLDNRFAIEVTDASGRSRSVSSSIPISSAEIGKRWYHVAAVKSGDDTLALYVDGQRVAFADVGVPTQTNVPRVLRVGTRVRGGRGYYFAGATHSIALWSAALRASEVSALYAGGNWSVNLTGP